MVQWLGLHAFTVEGPGSIPGWGTEILQTLWHSQKKKKKRIQFFLELLGKFRDYAHQAFHTGLVKCVLFTVYSATIVLLLLLFHVQMHTVWELLPALLSCLPSLEHNPWHPLDPEQPGRQNPGGSRPHPVGVVGRGQGGSWLAGRTGSGLSWTLRSLLRLDWQGPGKG